MISLVVAGAMAMTGFTTIAAPAAQAASTQTFVTMVSESGDWVGAGNSYTYWTSRDAISAGLLYDTNDGVAVAVNAANGDTFQLWFAAPRGEPLQNGTYTNAQRASFRDDTHPGIDIFGNGRGCNETTGEFTVRDFAYTDTTVTALDLTYEFHCESANAAPMFGQVAIGQPPLDASADIVPHRVDWPTGDSTKDHREVPVRVKAGASPVNLSPAIESVTTPAASSTTGFAITNTTCPGQLNAGTSCVITVDFVPDVLGQYTGFLSLGGDLTGRVRLRAETAIGYSQWRQEKATSDGDVSDTITLLPPNASFAASGDGNTVTITASGNHALAATFAAPSGAELTEGQTYKGAARYPDQDPTAPGFRLSQDNNSCSPSYASFTVHEIETDPVTGEVIRFVATYQVSCDTKIAPTSRLGSVAYMSASATFPAIPAYGEIDGLVGTILELGLSRQRADYGDTFTLRGVLRNSTEPIANQSLILFERKLGAQRWSQVGRNSTNSNGVVVFGRTARQNSEYRLEFPGSSSLLASHSPTRKLLVRHVVVAGLSDPKVAIDEVTKVQGHVLPRERTRVLVQVQRRNGAWRTFIDRRTNSRGAFSWKIYAGGAGTFVLRVVAPATNVLETGTSKKITMTVS